tara:strand:+ start:365 stop:883 length:519 start_codon:yes stop_codon:yes gene_type:complete
MAQGYNARLDDSMGSRSGSKSQSLKDRRDESEGMEKSKGKRKFSGNKSSAQGMSMAGGGMMEYMKGGKMKKMYESGGMMKAMLKDPKQMKIAMKIMKGQARDSNTNAIESGRAGRGKGENVAGSGMKMKYKKGGKVRGYARVATNLNDSGAGRVMKQMGQIDAKEGAKVKKK